MWVRLVSLNRLVGKREEMIPLPTWRVTVAYIGYWTRPDDVSFYVSRRYTKEDLGRYVRQLVSSADANDIQLLELAVFDGEREVWRGMV